VKVVSVHSEIKFYYGYVHIDCIYYTRLELDFSPICMQIPIKQDILLLGVFLEVLCVSFLGKQETA